MGIVDEDIERVKAAADFVQVASEQIALKKVGRRYQGLCPFHAEKTPSFGINAEEKLYYCFGCQASGDIIRFVEHTHHLDFVGAVELLAGRYGIQLRYDNEKAGQERQRKTVLYEAMERAVAYYHEQLLTSKDAGQARGYLRSRGYDRAVVERFRIGWAPDEWDALSRSLGVPADVLTDTGLGFVNKAGRKQDTFRARVMFPIFDPAGRPVAFGGRVLPGAEGSKYKNSPETKLYSKSRILYALNWAKDDAARNDEIIVCEGYTDVIAFFEAEVPRAVATCGTALADEHFRLLKNFAPRIVLAYDADAAGQSAASRFYEWEQRYEVDVAVAALPPGADPADLARSDPEALRRAVKDAQPFLEFRLDRVLSSADLRSPEGRGRAAEAALAVVAEHPKEFVRDQYLMRVADACRMEPQRLRESLQKAIARGRAPVVLSERPPVRVSGGPEVEALRLAVHRPESVAARLEAVLFGDEVNLAAFEALCDAETLSDAIAAAPPDAADLLQRLVVEDVLEVDADDVVRRLVHLAATRALDDLRAEARTGAWDDFAPTITWLGRTIAHLLEPATETAAAEQLVAWLVQFRQEGE
ncbi:MAG TPA: DNA primase [Acidimicrobiales bacterium]|jgi:DNA primase|nr:DNA primase [Acidimicrobiales bacterium]